MSSLQKPRKITIIGSDGRRYPLMCKPKDDLRKDARLMEFNTIINRLLKKDDESSRRQLQIRTYAVTPLNEECGLIEWVNNLRPLRDILLKSYKNKNIVVNYTEIRAILDEACKDPSRYHLFNDTVVSRFPDVFHEWFVETFPEPETWFAARLAYVRTTAVISMVGYILGLGDRHGENILYDEATGETQHVDFNCLFDKGLTFEKPERVPFRLTHNMVDAMGLTGYEGPFRRSSEIVMRVLRLNEESLMTVVETFLHDPLVEWLTVKKRRTPHPSKAPDNPQDVLESIENKLRGLHAGDPIPLSVEGQVQELIQQAVSVENLVHIIFFTPLLLEDAFIAQDAKRAISSRRFVSPSFNDIRLILNTAQIMSLVKGGPLKLVTFDGDVTLVKRPAFESAPVFSRILDLMGMGICVGVVTAAGYEEAKRYNDRLHGLLEAVHTSKTLTELQKKNLVVLGGESNFMFRFNSKVPHLLEPVPRDMWALDEMKAWNDGDITELLDISEATLRDSVKTMRLRADIVRKSRAVGIIPQAGTKFFREQLEETVLAAQKALELSDVGRRLPFCAFNGGNDVFVDIGDKRLGVACCQRLFGDIQGLNTLHVGDQFLSVSGNDFKTRMVCTTCWVASPAETVDILDEFLALAAS
ncbi:hypothetical protein ABW21_db0206080 [Orbilia brochopaga]|nr:hypothetical protein ABW21_db0206080 [Drechslerella brochopaga]